MTGTKKEEEEKNRHLKCLSVSQKHIKITFLTVTGKQVHNYLKVLKSLTRNIHISIELRSQSTHKNIINEAFKDWKIQTLKIALCRINS